MEMSLTLGSQVSVDNVVHGRRGPAHDDLFIGHDIFAASAARELRTTITDDVKVMLNKGDGNCAKYSKELGRTDTAKDYAV